MLPYTEKSQYHSNLWKFSFIGIRRCLFANDDMRMIGWCIGLGCADCNKITATLYAGADFTTSSVHDEAILPPNGGICSVAAHVINNRGGENSLKALLDISIPQRNRVVEKSFMCHRVQYIAVNPCSPTFERWGVVKLFDKMSSTSLVCQSCYSKPCDHVTVISSEICHSSAQLSQGDFEKLFTKKFDKDSGTLKVRCITSSPLPLLGKSLETWQDGQLYEIVSGEIFLLCFVSVSLPPTMHDGYP